MIVAVLLPSTGRAAQLEERAKALLDQGTPDGVDLLLVLAVPENDAETLRVAKKLARRKAVMLVIREAGTTAVEGWNLAYSIAHAAGADWFVAGADDIVWRDGWLAEALKVAKKHKAEVVGLNDGDNTRTNLDHYAAHTMVSREFSEAHLGGVIVPPAYKSWWFDREVCEKAAALGLYAPAHDAYAEHYHPDWKLAEMDETYRMARPLHNLDRRLYERRKAADWPVDYAPVIGMDEGQE